MRTITTPWKWESTNVIKYICSRLVKWSDSSKEYCKSFKNNRCSVETTDYKSSQCNHKVKMNNNVSRQNYFLIYCIAKLALMLVGCLVASVAALRLNISCFVVRHWWPEQTENDKRINSWSPKWMFLRGLMVPRGRREVIPWLFFIRNNTEVKIFSYSVKSPHI